MLGYRIISGQQIAFPRDNKTPKSVLLETSGLEHGFCLRYVSAMQIVFKRNEYSICIRFKSALYCPTGIKGPLGILEEIFKVVKGKYIVFTLVFIRYEAKLNRHYL